MEFQLKSRQLPFWIITAAILVGLVFSQLIMDGMFNDALLYISVAKNLGNDIGTFWNPFFSGTWDAGGRSSFHEQPPLVFALLSVFFKIFGDGIYTERIYTAITTILSAFLIHKIWQTIPHSGQVVRKMSWLPVFIWVTFPVIMWSHRNMMCENTMELFILGSVLLTCRALYSGRQVWWRLVLAGCCIFLAALSKGVPGLFPLAAVPVFWLIYSNFSFGKAVGYTLLAMAVVVVLFSGVLLIDEAREALQFYVEKRLMGRIENAPVVTDRFQLMKELAMHLLLVLVVIAIVLWFMKRSGKRIVKPNSKHVIFFFIIGLCGTVPLMLTLVQRGFYMTPAMPFFAIALSLLIAPTLEAPVSGLKTGQHRYKNLLRVSVVLLAGAIGFTAFNAGKTGRDKEKITAIKKLDTLLESWVIVDVPEHLEEDWSLETYLMRYAEISVDRNRNFDGSLYLSDDPRDPRGMVLTTQPIGLGGSYYLYARPGTMAPGGIGELPR